MGLNAQIGGELDVHGPATMDLVYEKEVKQEQRSNFVSNFRERNQKRFK